MQEPKLIDKEQKKLSCKRKYENTKNYGKLSTKYNENNEFEAGPKTIKTVCKLKYLG